MFMFRYNTAEQIPKNRRLSFNNMENLSVWKQQLQYKNEMTFVMKLWAN
jgi:hypothetical protein